MSFSAKGLAMELVFVILKTRGAHMVEKMVANIIGQMTEAKIINKMQEEYYTYSLLAIIERTITIGTIPAISLLIRNLFPTLFFLAFFLSLRQRTGGFHFNTFWQCYLGTVGSYMLIVLGSRFGIRYSHLLLCLLLLAIVLIAVLGTVNHPNMHMDKVELAGSKKAARLLVFLQGSATYFFAFLKMNMMYIYYMSIAIILCATLLCLAKIIKQEVREDEEN